MRAETYGAEAIARPGPREEDDIDIGMKDSLATVSSFTLSNTSIASFSAANEKNIVSNVRVCIVSGQRPSSVIGIRETSDMSGYGTCTPSSAAQRDP